MGNSETEYPADFHEWLSGKCLYSDPPSWTYKVEPGRIVIAPSWKMVWTTFAFFLVFSSISILVAYLFYGDFSVFGIVVMLFAGIIAILAIGFPAFLLGTYLLDAIKGPYLLYSAGDGCVSLPRKRLVVSMVEVRGWRLVSGNWTGPADAQKYEEYPMSELQLIVQSREGAVAYAVAGGKAESIDAQAREIARMTSLPLDVVDQHQGVSRPTSMAIQSWWSLRR